MSCVKINNPTLSDLCTKMDNNNCNGKIYRGYVSTFISSYDSIEQRTSLREIKRMSCGGCKDCGWETGLIQEYVSGGLISIANIEHGKLYRLKITTSQGYHGEYAEIDEIEFSEVKQ